MTGGQIGTFVRAYTELWEIETDARERLAEFGKPFSTKWSVIWSAAAALGFYLIFKTDWGWVGVILLLGPYCWFVNGWSAESAAKAARQDLDQIKWKDFDLRFQWRAFGLWDEQIHNLKKRFWRADSRHLDMDAPGYREWWDEVVAQAARDA